MQQQTTKVNPSEYTWTVDGTPIEVGPGQPLCIPGGAAHRFDNLGNEDVKQLVVIAVPRPEIRMESNDEG